VTLFQALKVLLVTCFHLINFSSCSTKIAVVYLLFFFFFNFSSIQVYAGSPSAFITMLSQCLLVSHKAKALTPERLPYVVCSFSSLFLGEVDVRSVCWFVLVGFLGLSVLKKMESMH